MNIGKVRLLKKMVRAMFRRSKDQVDSIIGVLGKSEINIQICSVFHFFLVLFPDAVSIKSFTEEDIHQIPFKAMFWFSFVIFV